MQTPYDSVIVQLWYEIHHIINSMQFCNKINFTCEVYNYEFELINIINCMKL